MAWSLLGVHCLIPFLAVLFFLLSNDLNSTTTNSLLFINLCLFMTVLVLTSLIIILFLICVRRILLHFWRISDNNQFYIFHPFRLRLLKLNLARDIIIIVVHIFRWTADDNVLLFKVVGQIFIHELALGHSFALSRLLRLDVADGAVWVLSLLVMSRNVRLLVLWGFRCNTFVISSVLPLDQHVHQLISFGLLLRCIWTILLRNVTIVNVLTGLLFLALLHI